MKETLDLNITLNRKRSSKIRYIFQTIHEFYQVYLNLYTNFQIVFNIN